MTATTTYRGTAREQWALAGIDLALGRITAAELHELGTRLMAEAAAELDAFESKEVERLQKEVYALEDDVNGLEGELDDMEQERDRTQDRLDALVKTGELALGDWVNVKARDALRRAITKAAEP